MTSHFGARKFQAAIQELVGKDHGSGIDHRKLTSRSEGVPMLSQLNPGVRTLG